MRKDTESFYANTMTLGREGPGMERKSANEKEEVNGSLYTN